MTLGIATSHPGTLITSVLKDFPLVEGAALYGSVARGDVEPHSDVDLLLLCKAGHKKDTFERVQSVLSREFSKLSLALYSHQELRFLSRAGSLFLLHLKREADVLLDRSGFLGALLSEFRPKPSYYSDFRDSLGLLDPLRTAVASAPNNLHRLSYAYSIFRVFGVYLLASRGIFEFSKARMAACLLQEYPRASEAVKALSGLRVLNANFFAGGASSQDAEWLNINRTFSPYTSALAELIGEPIVTREQSYARAVEEFATAAAHSQKLNYRLRTWFLLLTYDGINIYCRRANISPLTSFQLESLERVLSRPLPPSVACAATQALEHIRDYRLKYFLRKNTKINSGRATGTLESLAAEIE